MTVSKFHSSHLKIKRAKKHLGELKSCLDNFTKQDFYRFLIDEDAEAGYKVIKFELTKPVPEDISLIIGDIIHNLRSSLDLLISSIIWSKTGKWSKFSKFPFGDTKESLIGIAKRGELQTVAPAVVDFIIDVIKPYRTGDDTLYALHDLDIIDKHRMIITTIELAGLKNVRVEDSEGNLIGNLNFGVGRDRNTMNISVNTTDTLHIKDKGNPIFLLYFDIGLPRQRRHVVETLHEFTQLVDSIISRFETL